MSTQQNETVNGTTNVTANGTAAVTERVPFQLPDMVESEFSAEELAEDMDGMQMSLQRVKIPGGGTIQFEMATDDPDNPEYTKYLTGVILFNHATGAYWPEGSEYDDSAALLFCGWQTGHRRTRRHLCHLFPQPLRLCQRGQGQGL